MDKLPCHIINNILIIKYEEEIKQLKKQIENIKHSNIFMLNYLVKNEVNYCECCGIYGNEDEIIDYEDYGGNLCEPCLKIRLREENKLSI